jgi:hypothetical protein
VPESGGGGDLAFSVPFFIRLCPPPYLVAKLCFFRGRPVDPSLLYNTLAVAAFSAVQLTALPSGNHYASCTASVHRMAAVHPHLPRGWAVRGSYVGLLGHRSC